MRPYQHAEIMGQIQRAGFPEKAQVWACRFPRASREARLSFFSKPGDNAADMLHH
jgi:hypothetical protein